MQNWTKWKRALLLAGKIAVGSSLAIYTAELLHVQFSSSAGIVTLLTLLTSKKGTLRLSGARIVTFLLAAAVSFITFLLIQSEWLAFGLFVFLVALISEVLGWRATISTNAVIGTHFLMNLDFSPEFFLNEFLLVLIGIFFAFILNLFQDVQGEKKNFAGNIQRVEQRFQRLLEQIAGYLCDMPYKKGLWRELAALEKQLLNLMEDAYEYEGNTYREDAAYYARYFEMRLSQCRVLHNLQYEIQKIKKIPSQAAVVADYIRYMNQYVTELNEPTQQLQYLQDIFSKMSKEPLPVSREEFESRAVLYHILMDLEEFLLQKQQFIQQNRKASAV
ncbi:MAG: hypothetical protein K2O18_15295 [Oscillospiraceae bacterium]|nr:hypothetical protein [Oscillospiraceae bacterium]